jgi:hypothetical protein
VLTLGQVYMGTAWLAVLADSVMVLLFGLYLATAKS